MTAGRGGPLRKKKNRAPRRLLERHDGAADARALGERAAEREAHGAARRAVLDRAAEGGAAHGERLLVVVERRARARPAAHLQVGGVLVHAHLLQTSNVSR